MKKEIFAYDQYQEFLRDYFEWEKEAHPTHSRRWFAQKMGFSDHSILNHLVCGRRRFSSKTLEAVSNGIHLSDAEKEFFIALVHYNQAQNSREKQKYFEKLRQLRYQTEYYQTKAHQEKYFDYWYYAVIRELLVIQEWNGDYRTLAAMVKPAISPEQAKDAVSTLKKLKMLEQTSTGWKQTDSFIMPGRISDLSLRQAHQNAIALGMGCVDEFPAKLRRVLSYTFSMNDSKRERYYSLVHEFEERLDALIAEDDRANIPDHKSVWQCNIQLFPVSKLQESEGKTI